MELVKISCLAVFLLFQHIGFLLATSTGFMVNYCKLHKSVVVNDSLVLELRGGFLEDEESEDLVQCTVKVVTDAERRLLVHFISLEISKSTSSPDRLHIFDYKKDGGAPRLSPASGIIGFYDYYYSDGPIGVKDYMSSGNMLKLDYLGTPGPAYEGFKILITSFRASSGHCGRNYIRCNRKDICIPSNTWCDSFRNCGDDDESDEANCKVTISTGLEDGATTAVVAAACSCTVFLMITAIVTAMIIRLNKINDPRKNRNITVVYAKRGNPPLRALSVNGELTRLYAPPSYEVVIGMDDAEPPPDYQTVTASNSPDEEEAPNLVSADGPYVRVPTADDVDLDDPSHTGIPRHGSVCVTAEVTMDQDGNSCSSASSSAQQNKDNRSSPMTKKVQNTSEETDEICTILPSNGHVRKDVSMQGAAPVCTCKRNGQMGNKRTGSLKKSKMEQPILRRSNSEQVRPSKKVNIKHTVTFSEIEVLSSGDDSSDNAKDENRNKTKNSNGHARITYRRSPSQREATSIEFIDGGS